MPLLAASSPPEKPQGTPKKASYDSVGDPPTALAMVTPSRPPRAGLTSVTPNDSRPTEDEERSPYPIATLKEDSISDMMAARLTCCLIGHVLFLKSQIPYPVSQYPRMSQNASKDEKVMKKQDDFFSSLDVLFSHLSTTFTTLASSLSSSPCLTETHQSSVEIAIVLGANTMSMSAAKARVLLRLDGLLSPERPAQRRGRPRHSINGNLKENIRYDSSDESEQEDSHSDSEESEDEIPNVNSSPEDEVEEDIESVPDSDEESESDEVSESDELSSDEDENDSSYGEEIDGETEADLIAGERTLSRALAIANGEAEKSMSADLRVMHAHILLRAPRRFSHPSWTPQQALTRDMDALLPAFDIATPSLATSSEDSSLKDVTNSSASAPSIQRSQKRVVNSKHGVKTECVRVRCRNWDDESRAESCHPVKAAADGEEEENEIIWWSWNGKLEGFELL